MRVSLNNIFKTKNIIFAIAILLLLAIFLYIKVSQENNYTKYIQPIPTQKAVKISGWIAWWAEKSALELIQKHPGQIHSVSPVWFMINKDLQLQEAGSINKKDAISELKEQNVTIYPTLGSELSGQELSYFLNDNKRTETLTQLLVKEINSLGVEGVDINLEEIKKEDRDKFTQFLSNLSSKLKEANLKLSVTVHAQTAIVSWEGVEGQDLSKIGKLADEVRIMIYDEHTIDTQPGPISSFKWIQNVAKYNLTKLPKDKIIIGIPSYGYIWGKENSKGLQHNEFNAYLKDKEYTTKRDQKSGEIVVENKDFSGYLSDSNAMISKINLLKNLGFNNFIIWHLGGMDENFFYKNSSKMPLN